MTQVYTDNKHLILRLKTLLDDLDIVNSIKEITPTTVVLTDTASAISLLQERSELKVMALSDNPSFAEGSSLLRKGIKGYANTYIHLLHLKQAIEIINSGNIWLYPSFMQELISQTADKNDVKSELLDKLTQRERETALLIAKGKSNKEIAVELDITERTVKAHLTNIYSKTGLTDRLSLAKSIYTQVR